MPLGLWRQLRLGGRRHVALRAASTGESPQTWQLHSGVDPRAATIGGYQVQLAWLEPENSNKGPDDPDDYRPYLRVLAHAGTAPTPVRRQ